MDFNPISVNVSSEIGKLQHVLVHMPGIEIENMTPEDAHLYLFSDILNMQVAQKEYGYFKRVLQKVAKVHEVCDLLADILEEPQIKRSLIERICKAEDRLMFADYLKSIESKELARQLIEGVRIESIASYNKEKYLIRPLPNLFFMRDASFTMFDNLMISGMASTVRARECIILDAIYTFHPMFEAKVVRLTTDYETNGIATVEGGDVQIIRDDVIISGKGARTNMHGIESLVEHLKTKPGVKHLFFQELPLTPESFIHLDMVFTMLDVDRCMVYEPVILNPSFKTFHITIDGQKAIGEEVPNLVAGLKTVGIDMEPIKCGGGNDDWAAREQWHSGCNFFCLEPGKFIGYGRNQHTLQALNNAGFNVVTAADVVNNKVNLEKMKKCIIAFEGNELSRGGGGARCMTMPVQRMAVDWQG